MAKTKWQQTLEIKKHYKVMEDMRNKIIASNYSEHIKHNRVGTDTKYADNVFQCETILCECKVVLTIDKGMLEKTNGKEYKL